MKTCNVLHIGLYAFLLFHFIEAAGQDETILLQGKVVDSKTGQPLSHAAIGLHRKPFGTIASEEGRFEFKVSLEFMHDTLTVSHLGYRTARVKISTFNGSQTILLDEDAVLLKEITVHAAELTAKDVLEKSRASIPIVYPTQPYLMEAFFRSWEKIDFTDSITYPGTLLEAAAAIYDPGYGLQKPGGEKVYVHELRRSELMPGWVHNHNSISSLLSENDVRYNQSMSFRFIKCFLDFPNDLSYNFEDPVQLEGEMLYVIRVDIPNNRGLGVFHKVYVSMEDFAILRFELHGNEEEIDYTKEWHTQSVDHSFIFRRYFNKVYLQFAGINYSIKKINTIEKRIERSEKYLRELMVSKVITEQVETIRKSLGRELSKKSLEMVKRSYNENFWKNYNVLLENPVDMEIISWFEQKDKLEIQYQDKQ